ncbi:hypothetical protein BT96DRAFT_1007635 [Gymnopus androsaceus JB14]|uniref:Uncharacterized protein n=1 Tax=Gymnopus androsaceus JB14 TaxID=1447944 RepID=A0A6A4GH56_9AGAR|nr:hypothetical protein BT96DRAFT_1007635 [Gymnopus androsaceus JB14]
MATFAPRIPNGDLFHEQLLHVGKQTINEVLTGDYATGKHPHFPYPYHGNRATHPLELIVIDACNPMLVQSTHKSTHFNIIVDDYTSALGGGCFAKKNQANKIIQATINQ